jgi:hypothetical protein
MAKKIFAAQTGSGGPVSPVYNGSNGLTPQTTNPANIQLGGLLLQNTRIDTNGGFQLLLGDGTIVNGIIDEGTGQILFSVSDGGTLSTSFIQTDISIVMLLALGANTKNISFNTGMFVEDTISTKGLENKGDYEANFTNRSLVTKQYVLGVLPAAITAGNGLTRNVNDIELGGLLAANTEVALNGFEMDFHGSYGDLTMNDSLFRMYFNQGANSAFLLMENGLLELGFTPNGGAGFQRLIISAGGNTMVIEDSVNSQGLIYQGAYESNFIGNSLVTKNYVDTKVGATAVLVATNKVTGTMASGNLITYLAPGSTSNMYRVNVNAVLRTVTAGTVLLTVSYQDDTNTSRTASFFNQGSAVAALAATGAASMPPMNIWVLNNTNITIDVTITGTIIADFGSYIEFVA